MTNSLIFAGSGHGGVVAFKSLQKEFENIEVITDDTDIISLFRTADRLIDCFLSSDTKYVVCAGYHSIIGKEILSKKIIINTHPSLLPKYRGMHGLVWGMLNFEDELGFTIHLMNEYIDDGDILEQFKIKYKDQTSQEIMLKFDDYILHNLGKVVRNFLDGKIIPKKQNIELATWVTKRNIDDCIIDFNRSNKYIRALFKALVRPYPLPMIKIKNTLYEVLGCEVIDKKYEMSLGKVVTIYDEKAYIKTLEGLLVIEDLINYETKNIVKANSILKIGQKL